MSFSKVSIVELSPVDYNPRQIGEKELHRLQSSIKEHTVATANWSICDGYRLSSTITVNRNGNRIVGGHQRVKALKALGQNWIHSDDITWVDVVAGGAHEKALNISLNNGSASGRFDDAMLTELVSEISAETRGLFDALDLGVFLQEVEDSGQSGSSGQSGDQTPPVSETAAPESSFGQVYALGRHRVLCGDSCDNSLLTKFLPETKVNMLFTDPPYGVDYDGGVFHSEKPNTKNKRKKLVADDSADIYHKFIPAILPFVDGPCYMWTANKSSADAILAVRASGADLHSIIVWHKINATYAAMNAQYKERHELCLYFKPKGSTLRWCGPSDERTLWEMERSAKNNWHPTQKPVALAERAIKNHEVDTILDCFAGSGSTVIAAETLGKTCYGVEIDPRYVDVIRRRYAEFVYGDGCDWVSVTPSI